MFKTLIVEDNAAYRRSLSDLLRGRFPAMLVLQAETIGEALRKIDENRPGLVFVDIKLREENGLDLARTIRKSYPDTVVAVITSSNLPEYRDASYAAGANYFIPKGDTTSSDILLLVDSILSGQPPQWTLGSNVANPAVPRPYDKK